MRRMTIMLLAMTFTLAACAGDSASTVAGEPTFLDSGGETAVDGADVPEGEGAVRVDLDIAADRQVIRRASLQLHASDTRTTFEEIVAMAEDAGGFVADATVAPTNNEDAQPAISMTLRVPADQLTSTMLSIKDSADEVVSESQSAEDVTEQFVDLEARLTNLEALEVELRALLTEVRARDDADPDEILRVFNEVSSVRGQIEQLQGQINYLSDLTALATLDVAITQTPSAAPLVEDPWSPGDSMRVALSNLVEGLQGAADWAINFAIYVLPMLLIVLGPLAIIGVLVFRRFSKRPPHDPAPAGS